MSKILGIDLGTTNSVAAVMEGGEPVVINTAEGSRLCPSVVAFSKNGERLVGQAAKRQAVINSENTVSSIKRFIGRHYDEVEKEKKMVPYQVVKGPAGEARVKIPVNGREYSPQEISAQILAKLKADAEAYLGETVTKAVITVPAYFNDSQRQSTKDAGKIAGLEVLRIINEPTASALAYGLDKKKNEKILVFDLGGGTFDVSVLEVGEGVFEVKSTSGDTHLGGDDWDERIVNWATDAFKNEQGIDLREDKQALQRLREAAEKAKIELSSIAETTISLPYITADSDGPRHLDIKLNRATFEKVTADLLERLRKPFDSALRDAGFASTQIDEVVLVGGSTRMPMVQELVKKLTGKEPNRSVNPDEVVAIGAAIQAGVLAGEVTDMLLLDVTPLSLGLETLGGVMTPLIERNTTIPVRKSQLFSTAEDSQTAVDVHVMQGERPMAADNMSLGRFRLEGIPAAPRGLPQVEVTFDIDANGILNVSAKDRASQKEQQVTITASTNLSKNEIDRLMREAQVNKEGDENRRRVVEVRNQSDSVLYQTEKWLQEQPEGSKQEVGALLADLKRASEGDDIVQIQALLKEIEDAKQKYGQARPAAESPENPQGSQGESNGEVVEGQFEEA